MAIYQQYGPKYTDFAIKYGPEGPKRATFVDLNHSL